MFSGGPCTNKVMVLEGIKKFFRWLMPIAERHVMPHIKSGIETVGKQAVESASRIANDTISGRNIQEAAKEHVSQAIDNLKQKAEKTLSGKGVKKKKNKKII